MPAERHEPAVVMRIADVDERVALIELQRRASLANPGDRAVLEAHPDAVDTPLEHFVAGQVIVADVGGEVAGFAAFIPRADGALELDALFVEPPMWRRGIASALIRYGRDLAAETGVPAIHVIGNPHAREFYLALGFVPQRTVQTQFAPATEYVLAIAPPGAP